LRSSHGDLKDNKIYQAWQEARKEERVDFLYTWLKLYNIKACIFLQSIGKCKKENKEC